MKIIICRHGKPEGTEHGKRYLGTTDEALSDEGMEQADELGAKLADRLQGGYARIVSSDLIRAFETALVIKEHLGCEFIETDRDLREIDMGEWDGRYFEDIKREYPEEFDARGKDLWNYRVPGGESFRIAGERFVKVIKGLEEQAAPGEAVVIVSHHGAIRAGLSPLTDIPFEEWMKKKIHYAGAVILDITQGTVTVEGEL